MTPIDRLLPAVASVYVGVSCVEGPVVVLQSPLIPSGRVCDLQIINTEANQQPAAQGRCRETADGSASERVSSFHASQSMGRGE